MIYNPNQILAERGTTALSMASQYHTHRLFPNQCSSLVVQTINAPLPLVWSIVRRFDRPQSHKIFVSDCTLRRGRGGVGSIREVSIVSGLPAETSVERLDILDDDLHVMRVSVIGGDHRLVNYHSTLTLHEEEQDGTRKTVAMESYVVDVPDGNSADETCYFVDTIIGLNLRGLAAVTEARGLLKANNSL